MINSYSFGVITINGKKYRSDVIIYPEKIDEEWWREEGHNLCLEDIEELLEYKPDVLIIGTGYLGLMKVPEDIQSSIEEKDIEIHVLKTKDAVDKYNEVNPSKKTVAALHLTC